MDQYSRKSVMIATGIRFTEQETQHQLEETVLGMINTILASSQYTFTIRDFVAIHRNGRYMKGSRPPSVTVKFLRYFDKDLLFTKRYIQCRKSNFAGVNFHHCLCTGLIKEQKLLEGHPSVKFVKFEGTRLFTVCIRGAQGKEDIFYNRIHNYTELVNKLT